MHEISMTTLAHYSLMGVPLDWLCHLGVAFLLFLILRITTTVPRKFLLTLAVCVLVLKEIVDFETVLLSKDFFWNTFVDILSGIAGVGLADQTTNLLIRSKTLTRRKGFSRRPSYYRFP